MVSPSSLEDASLNIDTADAAIFRSRRLLIETRHVGKITTTGRCEDGRRAGSKLFAGLGSRIRPVMLRLASGETAPDYLPRVRILVSSRRSQAAAPPAALAPMAFAEHAWHGQLWILAR